MPGKAKKGPAKKPAPSPSSRQAKAATASTVAARLPTFAARKHAAALVIATIDSVPTPDVRTISTGSLGLDLATGVGGIPRGRITEVYGEPSGGKTTLALQACLDAQRQGLVAAFVDCEHATTADYVRTLGLDPRQFLYCRPEVGEMALDAIEALLLQPEVGIIVLDSLPALVPASAFEGGYDDKKFAGDQAKLQAEGMRRLVPKVSASNAALVLINQTREVPGVAMSRFVSEDEKETTPGARAVKFACSLRISVRPTSKLYREKYEAGKPREPYGAKVRARVSKNKLATPFRVAFYETIFGRGVDAPTELAELALSLGVAQRSGNAISLADEVVARGQRSFAAYLASNPDVASEIRLAVVDAIKSKPATPPAGSEDDSDES